MNRYRLCILVLLLAAFLVACGDQATETPTPTVAPAEEPTEVPAEEPAEGNALTGTIWNLTELNRESLLPTTAITAEFGEDGMATPSKV